MEVKSHPWPTRRQASVQPLRYSGRYHRGHLQQSKSRVKAPTHPTPRLRLAEHIVPPIETRRVMWSIFRQQPILSRGVFPGFNFSYLKVQVHIRFFFFLVTILNLVDLKMLVYFMFFSTALTWTEIYDQLVCCVRQAGDTIITYNIYLPGSVYAIITCNISLPGSVRFPVCCYLRRWGVLRLKNRRAVPGVSSGKKTHLAVTDTTIYLYSSDFYECVYLVIL